MGACDDGVRAFENDSPRVSDLRWLIGDSGYRLQYEFLGRVQEHTGLLLDINTWDHHGLYEELWRVAFPTPFARGDHAAAYRQLRRWLGPGWEDWLGDLLDWYIPPQ